MLNFKEYESIPEHTKEALERYITDKIMPGHFLVAVLSNDLFGAYERADSENIREMYNIVKFIYNRIPMNAWGSKEKVLEYVRK